MDLSIVPEAMKNRLIKLELSLKDDNLLRGKRRMLQNRRNQLKAKIRAMQINVPKKTLRVSLKTQEAKLKKNYRRVRIHRSQRNALLEEKSIL